MNTFCSPHKDGSISTKHQSACVWSNTFMMTKLKRGLVIHRTWWLVRFCITIYVTWNVPVLSYSIWHRLNWKVCISDILFSLYFTFYVLLLFPYFLLFILKGVDVIWQPENWKFGDCNRMNMPEFIHCVCICWHLFHFCTPSFKYRIWAWKTGGKMKIIVIWYVMPFSLVSW